MKEEILKEFELECPLDTTWIEDPRAPEKVKSFISNALDRQSQQTAREIVDEIETKKVNEWDDIPCGECGKPRGQSRNEKNTEFNQALSTLQDSIKKKYL